jgi:hypothetical protein
MEFPPKFVSASPADKIKIVDLGLQCWILAEKEASNFLCLDETILRMQKESQTKIEALKLQLEMQESMIRKQLQEEKKASIREAILEERQKGQEQALEIRVEAAVLKAKIEVLQEESEKKDILLSTKSNNQLIQPQSSQVIGKIGEKEVENILNEFVKGEITNVAKESHNADFRISIPNGAGNSIFLLDSKNFKQNTPIPKKDREKLLQDVDGDSTVSGGILVSLNSIIATKDHFEIEKTEKKKPVIYICLKDMDMLESGRCLAAAFRILIAISTTHDEEEKEDLLKKIQNQVREVNLRIREVTNILTIQNKQVDSLMSLKENLKKNLYSLQNDSDLEEEEKEIKKEKIKKPRKARQVLEVPN